jgi:hypothetical protein
VALSPEIIDQINVWAGELAVEPLLPKRPA